MRSKVVVSGYLKTEDVKMIIIPIIRQKSPTTRVVIKYGSCFIVNFTYDMYIAVTEAKVITKPSNIDGFTTNISNAIKLVAKRPRKKHNIATIKETIKYLS